MGDYPHTLIRASAGAGKTYQLTQRYIKLLSRHADPGRILAVTFTRKAAGEILDRLLSRLASNAKEDPAALPMLAQVCRSLHRVTICTLDSFFSQMARCYHQELQLPLQAQMVGDSDAAAIALRRQAIDAMLADTDMTLLLDLVQRLYHDMAQRGVTDFFDDQIAGLYDIYRQANEPGQWRAIAMPATLDGKALDEALNAARALRGENKRIVSALESFIQLADRGDWQTLLSKGLGEAIGDGTLTYYGKPLPEELVTALRPIVDHAHNDMIAEVVRRTAALYDLLHHFDDYYTDLRLRHRTLLFSDLPHRLRAADITDLSDLYFRLDGRIDHLMLDEFQDTSLEQWEILTPIAQEITSQVDEHWTRTFFCVGDVKQAIYGWRGGCAEVFDKLEEDLHLPPEASESLQTSYRSSQVVLEVVNDVFSSLSSSACLADHGDLVAKWQRNFKPHTAADKNAQLPGFVQIMTTLPDVKAPVVFEEEEQEQSPDHLAFVARQVAEIAQRWPQKTIGVLTSTNKVAAALLELLVREHALDASGEGGRIISGDPAVAAVLSALTLADHPGHTAAAFHVVNSPLGAIIGLEAAVDPFMEQTALRIRRALLAGGYAALITDWAHRLAPSCDSRNVTRLTQLIELAELHDVNLTLRPGDFVSFVQQTSVSEPMPAPVRVMTVHRAKGLEFDAVVLPELERKIGRVAGDAVCVYRPRPTEKIAAVFGASNAAVRAACPAIDAAHQQQIERRLQDDLCAMYVAMTRAKQAMYLFVKPLAAKKDGTAKSMGSCAASILRETLGPMVEGFEGEEVLFQTGDPAWAGLPHKHAATPAAAEPVPHFVLPKGGARRKRILPTIAPSMLRSAEHVDLAELLQPAVSAARVRGRVFHKWFEQIDYLPASSLPTDENLLQLAREAGANFSIERLHELIARFRAALALPAVAAALRHPDHPASEVELWRERAFAVACNGTIVRGALDRLVICKRAGRAIAAELIDYKSDPIDSKGVGPHVEAYRPQIEAYRGAVASMLDLPAEAIMAKLLFMANGQIVIV